VLFWGVLGALVMRAAGAYLIARFLLCVSGCQRHSNGHAGRHVIKPEANPVIRLVRRLMPVTRVYHSQKFFIRESSRLTATPLFIVLVFIELTDLVFAVDSIPAIFAVTLFPISGCSRPFPFPEARAGGGARVRRTEDAGNGCVQSADRHLPGRHCVAAGGSVSASWMFPKQAAAHAPVVHPPLTAEPAEETAPVDTAD
jgi:Integral membrane protein TerC family